MIIDNNLNILKSKFALNSMFKKYIGDNQEITLCEIPLKTDLEIAKTMLMLENERKYRPTVLFTNVIDYPDIPVLMNAFKRDRIYKMINNNDTDNLDNLYLTYNNTSPKIILKKPNDLKKLERLYDMPILKHQIGDAGFYITTGVTITQNFDCNNSNLGIYRIQVIDKKRALIFFSSDSDGYKNYQEFMDHSVSMPVSISIGANMAYYVCGAAKLSYQYDDYEIVSRLLGAPIHLYDLKVPAPIESQFIITGHVVQQKDWEGEFGEFKGYYGGKTFSPVLEVDEIYSCKSPFYPGLSAGKESGLTLSAVQGEILMYFHLKNKFDILSAKYRIEEYGEFVAIIETPQPCKELINHTFEYDKRLKFVICGKKINDPWKELSIFPFRTVINDYYYKGNICGEKVGFIFEERDKRNPVELY